MLKKIFFAVISIIVCYATSQAQTKADSTAIKETALNYIEGWYSGDGARMEKALFPELAKRGIANQAGKPTQIMKAGFNEMVEWTKKRPNLLKDNKNLVGKITIYEILNGIANVKCESKDFIDFIHLGKINGEWKIVNAIWEFNTKK
ncbi:MAG: hypothetical protein C0412_08050 [Flavobacterium sp.]|nr:hypothetical protein [Flavobacterium sp.]